MRDDLFQDEQFIAWKDGIHRLYLFLDSLDEGLLQVQTLATQLVDTLKKNQYRNKLSRLYIRIVCRTAVFPQVLEEGLKELWKEDLAIYELAPLRYADAETAAMEEGIEPQGFLSEVWNKNLVPLAIKPVTLKFLLKIYKQHGGQFSPDQTLCSLYLEGCRLLGKEINLSRHGANLTGNLDSDQRLIVAARIAAVTVFANRFAVWTGINEEEAPAEDVLVRQLILGHESSNGREIEVTEAAIREVLNTGLFSSRGSNRLGWAHQTYAEFLAAWYLNQHNLSLSQIMSLIFHPDGRVVPQLQEATAWLASMQSDVFQEVMKTDPDVLLQSDISTIHDESKAKLVESLLKLHHEEKLEYSRPWRYNNLKYPGLATQLESYIRDFTKNQWSRLVAIDIAEDCVQNQVQNSLADIALDPTQLYVVRQHAAHTVCSIGDEATKKRLKPLALSEVGDNLKGYGLRAVWSQHIDTEELLNHLSQPEQREAIPIIGGVYQEFIAIEFAQHLQLSDLPVALKWLEKLPKRYDLHYPFEELADSVMLKAWQNLNEPSVLEAFANIAILRLKQYDGILGYRSPREYTRDSFNSARDADVESLLKDSKEKRRQLIEKIVLLIPESENDFLWLTDIICSEDTLWMIENVTSAESPRAADIWVKLLHQALT
ncbi:MAG: hypothetical protein LH679_06615, partial [Cyanobacteria bacterium CAN_BIN43]|nr:hypothetical protein [Cyanobacteria bacterium CAN_BIN43]